MIYTPMTRRALTLAYQAHHGQADKAGLPYIHHPLHLAEQMQDEISCTVALLHDTVEDTTLTLADLALEFPPEVVEAVALLTQGKDVEYFDYIRSIRQNPIALKVKLADLRHNSDPSRSAHTDIPPEDAARRRDKYAKAYQILTDGEV